MKVPPGAPQPRPEAAKAPSSKKPPSDDPARGGNAFAAVLKGKREGGKQASAQPQNAPGAGEELPDEFGLAPEQRDPEQRERKPRAGEHHTRWAELAAAAALPQAQEWAPLSEVQKTQGPPEIRQVEAIVEEIAVALRDDGSAEVRIELNSRTLDGLRIEIARRQGNVAIQFHAASQEVAQLLARNVDSLSAALANREVNVSEIRVAGPGSGQGAGGAPKKGGSQGRPRGR
jgi:flagellar hook-length control protein FliK